MNNWNSVEGYTFAHGYEEFDGLGIKLFVKMNRQLTDADEKVLYRISDALQEELSKESKRLDPETHRKAEEERAKILSCFPEHIYVKEIPNGYCSRFCCAFKPWFLITTRKGIFKVGWRKSVINLEWTDSDIMAKAEELFTDDVTKYDKVIHCWGYKKLKEYVEKLLS